MTTASVEPSAAMKAAAKTRLAARREASCRSSMIKAAKGTGMSARLAMRRKSVLATGEPSRTPTVKSAGSIEVLTVDKDSAVGDVAVVVEHDSVVMPIVSPVPPAPAEPAEEANSKSEAELHSRSFQIQSRIPVPARPHTKGFSINQPRIILRHINNFGVRGFDHNGLPLRADLFLRCAL